MAAIAVQDRKTGDSNTGAPLAETPAQKQFPAGPGENGHAMPFANWKSQVCNVVQSLLFNNPHRVIDYRVRDEEGRWRGRSEMPAPVRRLFETEASPERSCPRTIQFVHHMLIPPGQKDGKPVKVRADIEVNFRLIREMATQEPSTTGQA